MEILQKYENNILKFTSSPTFVHRNKISKIKNQGQIT